MLRDGTEGTYPYFFVDVERLGWARVALNIVALAAVFAAAGIALAFASGRLRAARGEPAQD